MNLGIPLKEIIGDSLSGSFSHSLLSTNKCFFVFCFFVFLTRNRQVDLMFFPLENRPIATSVAWNRQGDSSRNSVQADGSRSTRLWGSLSVKRIDPPIGFSLGPFLVAPKGCFASL